MRELFFLVFRWKWRKLFFAETTNSWIQLFRYGFVGAAAFIVDFLTYCLLEWLGVHYLLAGILSFITGFTFNFLVSRWMIFRASAGKGIHTKELVSVLVISVIGLILTEILLFVGVQFLNLDNRLSKIIASIIVLFWNYAARKRLVYR